MWRKIKIVVDWVAAQWWKSGDNTPDNLSGLSLYAVPALGQTTGFGKTNDS